MKRRKKGVSMPLSSGQVFSQSEKAKKRSGVHC